MTKQQVGLDIQLRPAYLCNIDFHSQNFTLSNHFYITKSFTMTDALKIISLVNDQNTPSNVVENMFAGEFKATYDVANIRYYDSEGMKEHLLTIT